MALLDSVGTLLDAAQHSWFHLCYWILSQFFVAEMCIDVIYTRRINNIINCEVQYHNIDNKRYYETTHQHKYFGSERRFCCKNMNRCQIKWLNILWNIVMLQKKMPAPRGALLDAVGALLDAVGTLLDTTHHSWFYLNYLIFKQFFVAEMCIDVIYTKTINNIINCEVQYHNIDNKRNYGTTHQHRYFGYERRFWCKNANRCQIEWLNILWNIVML